MDVEAKTIRNAELTNGSFSEEPVRRNGASKESFFNADVGVVHDWLPVYGGAERVLEQILHVVPKARLCSLFDFLEEDQRTFLNGRRVETSFMQRLPFVRSRYRYYLPFAPFAIEQFDLDRHDMVISSSYVVAKGALTRADQLHVSYVHSPIRYAWDLHFQYLRENRMATGIRGLIARMILHYMRLYDATSAHRADAFIANSRNVARRIAKTYRRPAKVIYPPVDTEAFSLHSDKADFYMTMARLVPYKRVHLIVEAFREIPNRELVVIGDGPERERLESLATPNIRVLGYQPQEAVKHYMQRARAFIYAAEEDFGIVPVEAQACGTPVIALGRGGALETVRKDRTGMFFDQPDADSIRDAVDRFERDHGRFEPERIRKHAEQFASARFRSELSAFLNRSYREFHSNGRCSADMIPS